LLDKAGRGMYWTLRDAAPEKLWKRLPGAYGELLDGYLAALLPEKMADRRYLPHPKFGNGDEAFDGAIVEGSDLITLEFKSSVLRADRKYSGDPAQLFVRNRKEVRDRGWLWSERYRSNRKQPSRMRKNPLHRVTAEMF